MFVRQDQHFLPFESQPCKTESWLHKCGILAGSVNVNVEKWGVFTFKADQGFTMWAHGCPFCHGSAVMSAQSSLSGDIESTFWVMSGSQLQRWWSRNQNMVACGDNQEREKKGILMGGQQKRKKPYLQRYTLKETHTQTHSSSSTCREKDVFPQCWW